MLNTMKQSEVLSRDHQEDVNVKTGTLTLNTQQGKKPQPGMEVPSRGLIPKVIVCM